MTQTSIPPNNASTGHNPHLPPKSEPGSPPGGGRGANGRFAKGNPGGPGNPFARQVAAFRQELFQAVTKEDIAAIARAMIDRAKAGDVAAARIVLQYTVGRPAETVDPDRLDEMEWQQWQRENVAGDADKVILGMAAASANELARVMVPFVQTKQFEQFGQDLEGMNERDREEAADRESDTERQAERKARRAQQQSGPAASAPPAPRKGPAPGQPPPAMVEAPGAVEPAAAVSPVEAHNAEEGGQEGPPEGCAAAAMRVLRMLGAAVNIRGETARRAANDLVD